MKPVIVGFFIFMGAALSGCDLATQQDLSELNSRVDTLTEQLNSNNSIITCIVTQGVTC